MAKKPSLQEYKSNTDLGNLYFRHESYCMPHEESAKHTIGGMTAGATLGAMVGGPGGALIGGMLGGLAGLSLDEEENKQGEQQNR